MNPALTVLKKAVRRLEKMGHKIVAAQPCKAGWVIITKNQAGEEKIFDVLRAPALEAPEEVCLAV
jgi:hypothetical protein